jgi:hypothetical protein
MNRRGFLRLCAAAPVVLVPAVAVAVPVARLRRADKIIQFGILYGQNCTIEEIAVVDWHQDRMFLQNETNKGKWIQLTKLPRPQLGYAPTSRMSGAVPHRCSVPTP